MQQSNKRKDYQYIHNLPAVQYEPWQHQALAAQHQNDLNWACSQQRAAAYQVMYSNLVSMGRRYRWSTDGLAKSYPAQERERIVKRDELKMKVGMDLVEAMELTEKMATEAGFYLTNWVYTFSENRHG